MKKISDFNVNIQRNVFFVIFLAHFAQQVTFDRGCDLNGIKLYLFISVVLHVAFEVGPFYGTNADVKCLTCSVLTGTVRPVTQTET